MRVIRVILFLASVFLLFVACTPKKIPSNSDPATDIKHWAFKTGVPLLTGLGDYHHSVTTDNPVTQRYFDQGLVMSFAFNHSESIRAFRAARMLDEHCAMCSW